MPQSNNSLFILQRIFHNFPQVSLDNNKEKVNMIFDLLEMAPLIELLHHLVGIQVMKTHIFVGMLINLWMLFGVVKLNPESTWLLHWIILRCVQKIVRHFYNAYTAMDLKFEVFAIDYIRMTAFYVLYPLEYLLSLALVVDTLPIVK